MAKRLTATEKWVDPWFCGLSSQDKLFWIYLLDNCDHAGIWRINWALVNFHIPGYEYQSDMFKERIVEIDKEKWFIPKFIDFQYGTLNKNNRAHKSVIDILEKYSLGEKMTQPQQPQQPPKPLTSPLLGASKGGRSRSRSRIRTIGGFKGGDSGKTAGKTTFGKTAGKTEKEKAGKMTEEFIQVWNTMAVETGVPKIMAFSGKRLERFKEFLGKDDFRKNAGEIIKAIKEQKFLHGMGPKGWKISIDWLFANDENYIKVLERRYKNDNIDLPEEFRPNIDKKRNS